MAGISCFADESFFDFTRAGAAVGVLLVAVITLFCTNFPSVTANSAAVPGVAFVARLHETLGRAAVTFD